MGEWLKIPEHDADAKGLKYDPTQRRSPRSKKPEQRQGEKAEQLKAQVEDGNRPSLRIPPETRMWCYQGVDAMAPHLNGEVYWQPWDATVKATALSMKGSKFDLRFKCQELASGDLDCKYGNWGKSPRLIPSFFGRIAYHLFFSTRKPTVKSQYEILSGDWLVSTMYRRSLGVEQSPDQ